MRPQIEALAARYGSNPKAARAPFDTANAGYARGDDPGNVDENRGRIGAALGWEPRTPLGEGLEAMWSWASARVAAG